MIAVAVLAVLAAVALPSFMDSIRKGRRSEAINAISAIQQAQERWRANNPTYTAALADLAASSPTPNGYYSVALGASASATGYEVTATAAGSQVADTQCKLLAARVAGGALTYGSGSAVINWADPNRCWAK